MKSRELKWNSMSIYIYMNDVSRICFPRSKVLVCNMELDRVQFPVDGFGETNSHKSSNLLSVVEGFDKSTLLAPVVWPLKYEWKISADDRKGEEKWITNSLKSRVSSWERRWKMNPFEAWTSVKWRQRISVYLKRRPRLICCSYYCYYRCSSWASILSSIGQTEQLIRFALIKRKN